MKYIFWIPLAIIGILCLIHRIRHPDKTETQLMLDVFNGNIFKLGKE